jgi:threonylcarbamoyladenosine tRNA methylthiotransferase MtaB
VKLPNPVSADIKSERSKILRSLSNKKKRSFYESQIGKIKKVLFESENKKGYIYGFTDNYVKVRYPWNPSLINKIKCVKLTSIDPEGFVRISKEELELA